jgi:drug/metabolite transporter (DMT)-like permease
VRVGGVRAEGRTGWLPPAALALVAVIWGVTFTVADDATAVFPAADLVLWRFGLGALLLSVFSRSRAPLPGLLRRRSLVLGGLLGLGFLLQTWALTYTDALTSGFLTGLLVVFAPVAGWLFFRHRLAQAGWAGVGVAVTGVLVLGLNANGLGAGEMLTITAATVWGLHVVLLSRWTEPGHALRVARAQTAVVAALALVVVLARAAVTNGASMPVLPADADDWGSVLFLAVLATAAAMALLTWAQTRVNATRAAVILTLEPAVAGLTAAATCAALSPRTLVGAILLLSAMYLVEVAARPGRSGLGRTGRADRGSRPPDAARPSVVTGGQP